MQSAKYKNPLSSFLQNQTPYYDFILCRYSLFNESYWMRATTCDIVNFTFLTSYLRVYCKLVSMKWPNKGRVDVSLVKPKYLRFDIL